MFEELKLKLTSFGLPSNVKISKYAIPGFCGDSCAEETLARIVAELAKKDQWDGVRYYDLMNAVRNEKELIEKGQENNLEIPESTVIIYGEDVLLYGTDYLLKNGFVERYFDGEDERYIPTEKSLARFKEMCLVVSKEK